MNGQARASEPAPQGHIHLADPNPASTGTTIEIELLDVARVRVVLHDLVGRTVATLHEIDWTSPGSFPLHMDTTSLAPGTYFVTLVLDGRVADAQRLSVLGTR